MKSIALIFAACFATASANPAVSDVNGSLDNFYGDFDSDGGSGVQGSFAFPLYQNLGIQADGLFTQIGDVDFGGAGAHVFWRNESGLLLGLEAGFMKGEVVSSREVCLEAQYTFPRVTLATKIGYADIEYDNWTTYGYSTLTSAPFIDTDKGDFLAQLAVSAYPVDNLMVTCIAEERLGLFRAGATAEYQLPVRGLSVFANCMFGENGYDHAMLGLRYYFGDDKPLIARHRQDLVPIAIDGTLYGIGTYGHEYNRRAKKWVEEQAAAAAAGSGSYGSSSSSFGSWSFQTDLLSDIWVVGPNLTIDPRTGITHVYDLATGTFSPPLPDYYPYEIPTATSTSTSYGLVAEFAQSNPAAAIAMLQNMETSNTVRDMSFISSLNPERTAATPSGFRFTGDTPIWEPYDVFP